MADEELLSKEEIDALLTGVEEGDVETQLSQVQANVERYDFSKRDRIVRGKLPTLEMINERFVRFIKQSMFNFLRQPVEVKAAGIESVKFADFVQTLPKPTSFNKVKMKPLRGTALFVFNAEMVFKLVEKFFGGTQIDANIVEREFTPTEQRVIHKILLQIFNDLSEAWKTVKPVTFEYVGSEFDPAMVNFISASEMMVLCTFEFTFDESIGLFQLAIPFAMLEPVRDTLDAGVQADVEEGNQSWTQRLQEDLMQVRLPIGCVVAERKIKLRDILSFKAGDIIPIEMPETNKVYANGMPVFDAKLGALQDNLALKIVRRHVKSAQ